MPVVIVKNPGEHYLSGNPTGIEVWAITFSFTESYGDNSEASVRDPDNVVKTHIIIAPKAGL